MAELLNFDYLTLMNLLEPEGKDASKNAGGHLQGLI